MKLASRMPEKADKTKYTSFFIRDLALDNSVEYFLPTTPRPFPYELFATFQKGCKKNNQTLTYPLSRSNIKFTKYMSFWKMVYQTLPKLGYQVNHILRKFLIEFDSIPNLMGKHKVQVDTMKKKCSICATLCYITCYFSK